ncbi:MAG: hypothetical protein GY805_12815 [Chloroflexi bacterium]|nr:hypothetical protein [Chloroflexota bacterium]
MGCVHKIGGQLTQFVKRVCIINGRSSPPPQKSSIPPVHVKSGHGLKRSDVSLLSGVLISGRGSVKNEVFSGNTAVYQIVDNPVIVSYL